MESYMNDDTDAKITQNASPFTTTTTITSNDNNNHQFGKSIEKTTAARTKRLVEIPKMIKGTTFSWNLSNKNAN